MTDLPSKEKTSPTLRQRAEEYLWKNRKKEKQLQTTSEIMLLLYELQVHQLELELQNQELQESQAQTEIALAHYTDLYDSALTGYFTFDDKGTIVEVNIMGAFFLGMERSKIIGKYFVAFLEEDKRFTFNDFLKKVFGVRAKHSCEIALLKSGLESKLLYLEATALDNGKECRAVVQDITERIQKEKLARLHQRELNQVMRMNSMGELASAIAHEINQPLGIIVNYANGCVRRLESNNYEVSEILNVMRLVVKQAELAGEIMHHMQNITHQDATYYKRVSINDIVETAALQIQEEIYYDLSGTLELNLGDNLPMVNADYIQIELVVLNLLRNSLEATCHANVKNPKILLHTEYRNNRVFVSITNNGPHYLLEEEAYLFKPSFTTKKTGMGKGLSISRTIIEAHLGYLSAHKMPIVGVCFQFSLPISDH